MFSIQSARYFLYRKPTDMRKSFNGLCGISISKMKQNPMSGDVYIFINKKRNLIKLLRWEQGGFVLFYKRLEKGTFELPEAKNKSSTIDICYTQLTMLITGISLKNARKRPRFLQQNYVGK